MWLKFGVSCDNALVCIEDIPSGKTSLTCLYCGGSLTAKKGRVKEHHFAHTQETCRPVAHRVAYRIFQPFRSTITSTFSWQVLSWKN
jgi:hypothetical protein